MAMGTMALTSIYGRVDRWVALATLARALDIGFDHFDTAELYGPYRNEELVAEALAGHSGATIATKVGYRIHDGKPTGLDARPDALRTAIDGSLRRLRRERIDLVYLHRQDPEVPVEDAIGCLGDLVREGKILHLGLSHVDAATLMQASTVHPITALQNEISLLTGPPPPDLLAAAAAGGTAILGHSPIGRGLLAGINFKPAADDYRSKDKHLSKDDRRYLFEIQALLYEFALNYGMSMASMALAWVRTCGVLPVFGPKTAAQVDEVAATIDFVLSSNDMRRFLPAQSAAGAIEFRCR